MFWSQSFQDWSADTKCDAFPMIPVMKLSPCLISETTSSFQHVPMLRESTEHGVASCLVTTSLYHNLFIVQSGSAGFVLDNTMTFSRKSGGIVSQHSALPFCLEKCQAFFLFLEKIHDIQPVVVALSVYVRLIHRIRVFVQG